jgi:tetratricopeptide (TPR) repeat protein
MERRFGVHAGALALIAALAGVAYGAPKKRAAKLQFQKGVAAYQKADYAGASAAFERAFKIEVDQETLFAWAQAERKLDHCDRATELYTKLLAMKLPDANRAVVEQNVAECAALQPKPVEPAPAPAPPPAPVVVEQPAPTPAPAPLPVVHEDSPLAQPRDTAEPEPHDTRAWYRDPVGDAFAIAGVGGLAAGAAFLVSAHSADHDAAGAGTYQMYESLEHTAHSRGETGVIAVGAGVAFVAAAVVWYVER